MLIMEKIYLFHQVIALINEEVSVFINEEAISSINEAAIGEIIARRNPSSWLFLFYVFLFY